MMGIDIGGAAIVKTAGITLNTALTFDAAGRGNAIDDGVGYSGFQNNGTLYYSLATGWPTNISWWNTGLVGSTGVFTCPVAGVYALGYNGLHRGGSGIPATKNTYGYSAFAKNGVVTYYVHWNQGNAATPNSHWNASGSSVLFSCAAGDTLALFVNRAPSPVGPDCVSQNLGMYPSSLHAIWCRRVG
jgi:hypothetical protein